MLQGYWCNSTHVPRSESGVTARASTSARALAIHFWQPEPSEPSHTKRVRDPPKYHACAHCTNSILRLFLIVVVTSRPPPPHGSFRLSVLHPQLYSTSLPPKLQAIMKSVHHHSTHCSAFQPTSQPRPSSLERSETSIGRVQHTGPCKEYAILGAYSLLDDAIEAERTFLYGSVGARYAVTPALLLTERQIIPVSLTRLSSSFFSEDYYYFFF